MSLDLEQLIFRNIRLFSRRVIAKIACNISGTFMFGTNHGSNAQTYQMVTMDGKLLTLRLKSQAMVTITYSLNCAKHRWSYFIFYQNQSFLVGLVHFIRALWEGNRFCLLNCCGSVSSCLFGRQPIFVGWFWLSLFVSYRKKTGFVCLALFISFSSYRSKTGSPKFAAPSQTCVPLQFDRAEISTIILSINCVNLIS